MKYYNLRIESTEPDEYGCRGVDYSVINEEQYQEIMKIASEIVDDSD